jgi:hypothetical protein
MAMIGTRTVLRIPANPQDLRVVPLIGRFHPIRVSSDAHAEVIGQSCLHAEAIRRRCRTGPLSCQRRSLIRYCRWRRLSLS